MRRIPLTLRIVLLAMLPIVVLTGVLVMEAFAERGRARDQHLDALRHLVDLAVTTMAWSGENAIARGESEAAAREAMLDAAEALRFDGGNYFFVLEGTTLRAHGLNPALRGNDLGDFTDAEGTYVFREFDSQIQRSGEARLEYMWPRTKGGEPERKISYARGIPGTDLWIGAGSYIDGLDALFHATLRRIALIVGAVAAALVVVSVLIVRSITGPLASLSARMSALVEGDAETPVDGVAARDRIGAMARALDVFRQRNAEMRRLEAEQEQAEKRAAAARQAMLDDLAGSFGGIVDAAAEGDFSRRVDHRFDQAVAAMRGSRRARARSPTSSA
jgi:methyl-accepting chemotaxis protein